MIGSKFRRRRGRWECVKELVDIRRGIIISDEFSEWY